MDSRTVLSFVARGLLAAAAIVQLLPMVGVLGPALLAKLYGVATVDPTHLLLLRHRAVLLGLVGLALCAAVGSAALRPAMVAFALVSKVSFIALYLATPGVTPEARRVAHVDMVSAACVALAALALGRERTLP